MNSHYATEKRSLHRVTVRAVLYVNLAILTILILATATPADVTPLPVGSAPRVGTVQPLSVNPTASIEKTEQWVTVEGRSPLTSGKRVARKQALLDAYRRAINAGGSIEIGEFSQLRNFKDVVDLVTKRSHGYIKQYEILADDIDSKDPDTYMVAIRALVVDGLSPQEHNDEALLQFVSLIGSPKVLFVLASENEQNATDSASSAAQEQSELEVTHQGTEIKIYQTSEKTSSTTMAGEHIAVNATFQVSSAEHEMAQQFRNAGYEVLTSDDILSTGFVNADDLSKARQGLGFYAAKVGRYVNADIVISGAIKYQVASMNGGTDVGAHLGTVSLTAKAILPGSGQVLHVTSSRQRHMTLLDSGAMLAREEAMARASKIAADELKWKIPQLLAQETRDIKIEFNNISYEQSDKLRKYLMTLEGVESVYMAGWKDKQTQITVKCVFTGPRENDLIEALQNRYTKMRIVEAGNYRVAVTM